MRGPEARFWNSVRRALGVHRFRAVRIEANRGEAEAGTPDVILSHYDRTRWIELKVYPEGMRASQVAWALAHDQAECDPVLVLVKRNRTAYLMRWYDYGDDPVHKAQWSHALWSGPVSATNAIVNYL